jgi:NAD(P)H dehydrogenase (quinone)
MCFKRFLILACCFFSYSFLSAQEQIKLQRIAKIKVDASQLLEYKAALQEQMTTALKLEPGVLSYTALSDKKDPTSITIFEVYASTDAYQAHITTPHFKKYKETVKDMVLSLELIDTESIGSPIRKNILITYYSKTGHTAQMASAIAAGARINENINVVIKTIDQVTQDDLLNADAIILGSPVYNANPAHEVLEFIQKWPFSGMPLKDKIGAVFVTSGGISSGEELVQSSLLHSMLIFGMVVIGGEDWKSAFGASAITNETPFSESINPIFSKKAEQLGKRVAEASLRWNKYNK